MELRLPGSGTLGELIKNAVLDNMTSPGDNITVDRYRSRHYDGVSAEEVSAVIDLLGDGSLEYVGLIDTESEVQAAEVPGGFVFERRLGDEFVPHRDTLTLDQLRAAFLAFHAGDLDAGLTWPEAPPPPEPKKRRGLFRR